MGCFSPPGDERLEEKAERHNAKTQRNKGVLGESNSGPLYLFWTFACSFFRVVLVIAHVLVVEMTSLSTLTFHLGIPWCLWRPIEEYSSSASS